jgi:hypothetical protein
MAINTRPITGFCGMLKQKLGYFALAAFLLETSVISWSIKRRMTLQEIENRDRISIGLANYSLK